MHPDGADMVLLFAVLEHLTQEERIRYLSFIWHEILRPGGYLIVVDTPNRLSYFDEHTSVMPFFHLLPPYLALRYFDRSPPFGICSGDPGCDPGLRRRHYGPPSLGSRSQLP